MASAAEQMASNFNLGLIAKSPELKQRIFFTLGALLVYRLGTYIPLPGIDPQALAGAFNQNSQGVVGMFNMFSGGAIERMAIFALNIMPYISASIIIQLLTSLVPSLEALKKEGESGRKVINQYTRYLTVVLAIAQSWGIAIGLQSSGVTQMSGPFFIFTAVVTLTGGTMFVVWLGEQITARGIGNGSSMIIFTGIVAGLPGGLYRLLELGRTSAISTPVILSVLIMGAVIVAFVVFMERAQRRLLINYSRRQVGNKMYDAQSSFLPLKLNTSGVIPPIFASSLLLLPTTFASFASSDGTGVLATLTYYFGHGKPLFMISYALMIVFFAFFYTAIVFNPKETAENLKKQNGFIPGIRPGERTAEYIDKVLTRITVIGAGYLVLICLLPEFFISSFSLPFYVGGTSLLIVVSVTMDTVAQVHGHLVAHRYEGLIKKSKLRGSSIRRS